MNLYACISKGFITFRETAKLNIIMLNPQLQKITKVSDSLLKVLH